MLLKVNCFAQLPVTIPWSSSLNVDFGTGKATYGPPLSVGHTDFIYSTTGCPADGHYIIVNNNECFGAIPQGAGHLFFGAHPTLTDSDYIMVADYEASETSKIVFIDTVKNLCSNNAYLFWAAIRNISQSSCFYPSFTFSVETLLGQTIKTFQTGDIGGPIGHIDNYSAYFGYQYPDVRTTFPYYYGLSFTLPDSINDVVVQIKTNPSAVQRCEASFAMDNILLTPLGADINIFNPKDEDVWLTGTCFQGNLPLVLSAKIGSGYYDFNTFDFKNSTFKNPAVQWQQSLDDGYTWTDIPGETTLDLSHIFSVADTFLLRLRGSENYNINNSNCSVVSNVIQVQVDGLPTDFNITSNSPVCTDSDIVLNVTGGASYTITGPNGYSDNTSYPHVYHPVLADSGWYHLKIISFGGCTVDDSTFVKVFGPDLKVSLMPDSLCYGSASQLHASGGNTYVWSPPDELSNVHIPDPVAAPHATTTYTIKATDNTGCSAFGSVAIIVRDSVLKAAIAGTAFVCPNDAALFKDTSTGKIITWNWSFGNGETSNMQNPGALYYHPQNNNTTYPVELIVTDSAKCSDTALTFIKAVNNCYIAVPSAFTPNHDGLNDYLYPLNAYKATHLLFRVYNRYGKPIFETKDWTIKWDGTFSGIPQPTGTYIWTLNYTDADNNKISLKGTSVLLR